MALSRYQKIAKKAIEEYLQEHSGDEAVVFAFLAEGVADQAAYSAGKKTELFDSLWDYERILPRGAEVFYNSSQAKVRNPYCGSARTLKADVALAGPFDAAIDFGPGKAYLPHSAIP